MSIKISEKYPGHPGRSGDDGADYSHRMATPKRQRAELLLWPIASGLGMLFVLEWSHPYDPVATRATWIAAEFAAGYVFGVIVVQVINRVLGRG